MREKAEAREKAKAGGEPQSRPSNGRKMTIAKVLAKEE
mgnify:FL=1